MGSMVGALSVRSRKLSNVGLSKIYYLELLRALEDNMPLSRWSWLRLQSLAPTNPHWDRVVGYGLLSLCVIHKKGLRTLIDDELICFCHVCSFSK
jgi:hypothetical protein